MDIQIDSAAAEFVFPALANVRVLNDDTRYAGHFELTGLPPLFELFRNHKSYLNTTLLETTKILAMDYPFESIPTYDGDPQKMIQEEE